MSEPLTIRPARPADSAAISALNARAMGPGRFARTAYRVREAEGGALWCEAEAQLVGIDPASGSKRPFDARFREALSAFEGL